MKWNQRKEDGYGFCQECGHVWSLREYSPNECPVCESNDYTEHPDGEILNC